jgi:hypothetical protein
MKRFLLAFVVACGGARVPEVSLATPAPANSAVTPATLLECTIVGTGERRREGEDADEFPFRVFESEEAREPVFVIARPDLAHVTWSHFPERAGRGRAQVGLGGQMHVRYDGFADLYGRTFTATTRMDSIAGHLWAHGGSPIDVMSATNGGDVFASVQTPFKAPRTIVVQGNCANIVYEPTFPPRASKERNITAMSDGPSFRLFASPASGRALTTITPEASVVFDVVERSGEFVRVTGDEGHIGFDAWVLAADTRAFSGGGQLHGVHRTRPPSVRVDGSKTARVARDTPLYVSGDEGAVAVRHALVEHGAVVAYDPARGQTADGREVVPFEFVDRFIVAPEGRDLWIARDVVSSAP